MCMKGSSLLFQEDEDKRGLVQASHLWAQKQRLGHLHHSLDPSPPHTPHSPLRLWENRRIDYGVSWGAPFPSF